MAPPPSSQARVPACPNSTRSTPVMSRQGVSSKDIAPFIGRIEKHKNEIAKQRDALLGILSDLEAVIDSSNRGIEALDEAIAAISELV